MARAATSPLPVGQSCVETLVERAVSLIHSDILTGVLAPDAKLRIHELSRRYNTGPTPIREALSRLCLRGFVVASTNRGFRVRPISRADLEDIVGTRLIVEIEALRLSIARGGDEWEAAVLSSFGRLLKVADREEGNVYQKIRPEGVTEFESAHKQFHSSLISACGLPRLIELHEMLYDQTYRYQYVAFQSAVRYPRLREVHVEMVEAAIARDVKTVSEHLTNHILSTLMIVYPESRKDYPQFGRER